MNIISQTDDLALIEVDNTGVIVSFSNPRTTTVNTIQKISYKGNKQGICIRFWGQDNSLPQYREQIVSDNNIVPTLIQTKRDITLGAGLYAFRKEFISDNGEVNTIEVPMPKAAQEFFDRVDIYEYLMEAAKNLFMHANIFTEFIRKNDGTVDSIKVKDCKYVRLGEQNDQGRIEKAYISGAWAQMPYNKEGETPIDREITPVQLYIGREDVKQPKFILHTGDNFINDGYYNSPAWFGSMPWIELANAIPIYHQSNIKHGYTIRYHVKVPKGYFYTDPGTDAAEAITRAQSEEKNLRQEFMQQFNDLFAGKNNAGRALFTQFDINVAIGSTYPGITVEPINVDIKDEALLSLFEKSNTANISSQGIHPTLANIETQGRLSSGSEIRNALNMYLAIKTPTPRRILLKAINLVGKINGWDPEIHFGFSDTKITTLDDDPSGTTEDAAVAPTPAPAKK